MNSFNSAGTPIAYHRAGESGDPLILIHGFTVDSDWNWEATGLIEILARSFRVIAMDVRGHGESGKPHASTDYGQELLHDISRLMDHLGIEKAHLVGYSMGGEIALAYLAHHPERMLGAVIGGGGIVEKGDDKYRLWELDGERLGSANRGETVTDIRFPGVPLEESLANTMNAQDPLALSAVAYGMLELALDAGQLAENTVPTLLLIGEQDEFKYCADRCLQVGQNIEIKILAGQNHITAISDPNFGRIAEQFLLNTG
jgi:pimeloyl-ACP methyl ester carboxylesterase